MTRPREFHSREAHAGSILGMEGNQRVGQARRGGRETSRLGLVLSGGGARGAFQVGVYERLLRDPRFANGPAVISGTSAGAINGALIAAGRSPRQMMEFWNGVADNPPATASPLFFSSAL